MGPREQRMIDLGFSPECNLKAGAIYRPVVIDGTTAYVAGCVPFDENQQLTSRGKVLSEVSLADAQKAAALSEQLPRFVAELAYVLALSGRKAEARRMLHDLSDTSMRRYISPQDLALICAGLNDHDAAFQWLDKAYAERSAWLPWLNRDPRWDTLRSDSRFSSLVHRIGLPD